MTDLLPFGFEVRLARAVQVRSNGALLIGGSPATALALQSAARKLVVDGRLRVTDSSSRMLADRLLDRGLAEPVVTSLPDVDPNQITVVIPVRDQPDRLGRLLASIGEGHRMIVVDDASPDRAGIAQIAAAAGAELIRLDTNHGPAAARNAGLARVATTYVAFVDSDVELTPGVLERLGRHFTDPRVVLVAPRICGRVPQGTHSWFATYDADRSSLDLGADSAGVRPGASVSWLPSACLLVRTSAMAAGFDDSMDVGEDVDLVWRLADQGHRIRYDPTVKVFHDTRPTVREVLSRKVDYGTSADELHRRHGSAVAPAVLAPWSTAVVVALLAQRSWSLPVSGMITGMVAIRIANKVPTDDHALALGLGLACQGVFAALAQTSALALRHWWPLGLTAALISKRARRFVITAATIEAASDYRRIKPELDPIRYAVAHRLDDLAYGTGVWLGAIRARSVRALLPDVPAFRTFVRS